MLLNFFEKFLSPSNKIVIVDFVQGQVSILKEFMSQGGLIQKIFNQLELLRFLMDRTGQFYRYQQQEQDLNHNGYAEIYPQIVLYKTVWQFLNQFNDNKHLTNGQKLLATRILRGQTSNVQTWSFVLCPSVVQVDSFVLRNSPERKALNR